MIEPQQAAAAILDATPTLETVEVTVENAWGRCLAEAVAADRDQPPFHRVTMDGVALNSAAVTGSRPRFRVQGIQAAGAPPAALGDPEGCLEVMTGAVLPSGCDCVVPVEELERDGQSVVLTRPQSCRPWRFVHRQGTDYPRGQPLLAPGQRLGAPELAVLAAVGRARVHVRARPAVAVFSTGDELVEPGADVAPQQIRMSNDYAIYGRLHGRGIERLSRQHVADDRDRLRGALAEALAAYQVLVLSGGVSRGRYDYLPGVLDQLGVEKRFHRVRQKPGKPLWFGVGPAGQLVFALPGNPVSALVCFTRYVVPALDRMEGLGRAPAEVTLAETMSFDNDLTRFVPVCLAADQARPRELNTSGDFFGLAGTDGFCELAADPRLWKAGSRVPFHAW